MKYYRLWLIGLNCLITSVMAETLYVNSDKAPLMEAPAFNSAGILMLRKGDEVTLLDSTKHWLKVDVNNQHQGWVSALLLKTHPPLKRVNLIGSDDVTLEGEARRRASSVATAGATRGLAEGEQMDNLSSDYQELHQMEALVIQQDLLVRFSYELNEAKP
ncbi:MAG: SH3 domain-containing protein [Reinekea sp.]|jgi:hypothetical protein